MPTHIYRLVYGGVCEIWVDVCNGQITKVIAANASTSLLGKQLEELPNPRDVEAKLVATYRAVGEPEPPRHAPPAP
jgi:hypothetical protein